MTGQSSRPLGMVLTSALIYSTFLAISALGDLPLPGAPYRIQNLGTNFVFDNALAVTVPGNLIFGVEVHTTGIGPEAQRISVKQAGVVLGSTTAGLFEFSFPMTGVGIFVKPAVGLALNVQNFSTQFLVTEVLRLGLYTITYPFTDLAVASPAGGVNVITLQPLNASNSLQLWRFVSDFSI